MSGNVVPLFRDEADAYAVHFALEHIRKGWYDDEDLRIAGLSRQEAEAYQRQRTVEWLAHTHSAETLREALAIAERRPGGWSS